MKLFINTITLFFLIVISIGCQENVILKPPSISPTLEPTEDYSSPKYHKLTLSDLCKIGNNTSLELGSITIEDALASLDKYAEQITPSESIKGLYFIESDNNWYELFFYDGLLTGIYHPIKNTELALVDIVNSFGKPDKIYSRTKWLFGCEGDECVYEVKLIYNKIGLKVNASGTENHPIEIKNNQYGIFLEPSLQVESVLCFIPNELDKYLLHAFPDPVRIDEKYLHDWPGFNKIIPVTP